MNSQFFSINVKDVSKSLVVAVIVAVLGVLQQMFSAHGLDFASFDWNSILNVSLQAGAGYLLKNFISDSQGKVLGKIG